jgi:hypothetical protein
MEASLQIFEELFAITKKLNDASAIGDTKAVTRPLSELEEVVRQVERSFSGSWLG